MKLFQKENYQAKESQAQWNSCLKYLTIKTSMFRKDNFFKVNFLWGGILIYFFRRFFPFFESAQSLDYLHQRAGIQIWKSVHLNAYSTSTHSISSSSLSSTLTISWRFCFTESQIFASVRIPKNSAFQKAVNRM
jgi:hypothetical protein